LLKRDIILALETYALKPELFSRKPNLNYVDPMYDEWIERQLKYYSMVRVIELSSDTFILVYGDVDDNTVTCGTGPFDTLDEATRWFTNGGR
jgi:hypothetical protein